MLKRHPVVLAKTPVASLDDDFLTSIKIIPAGFNEEEITKLSPKLTRGQRGAYRNKKVKQLIKDYEIENPGFWKLKRRFRYLGKKNLDLIKDRLLAIKSIKAEFRDEEIEFLKKEFKLDATNLELIRRYIAYDERKPKLERIQWPTPPANDLSYSLAA